MHWTINGKTYRTAWVNPTDWEAEGKPTIRTVKDDLTIVFVVDDSVPRGDVLDEPPTGELHVIAAKAQTAVGNVLVNRNRIEFLRLARVYPLGMDGPVADPNPTGNKTGPTAKRLLQPGEFPGDREREQRRTDDGGPGLGTLLAATVLLTGDKPESGPPHSEFRNEQKAVSGGERDGGGSKPDDPIQSTETAPPVARPADPPRAEPAPSAAPDYTSSAPDYSSGAPIE